MEVASLATILTVLVLNILLPTIDTFTDINLVTKLYHGAEIGNWNMTHIWGKRHLETLPDGVHVSHPVFASVLLVPFLLNYVTCWYAFYREARYKKYTFIFPLLNLYPQFGQTHFKGKIVGFFISIFQRLRE